MQFYPHRTVEEQANRLPEQLRSAYLNSQIDRITISDGASEIEVTGYAEYSYLEEKSYKTQPVRTMDGVIHDIDEYATFLTPRLIIKYNMMNIDDYRALMLMLQRKNAFTVECYDVVRDMRVVNEMYFAPSSMPIIYQQYLMSLGIREYTIELIGTNRMPSTNHIEFYIDGELYTVSKGTTWRQWVNNGGVDFDTEYSAAYENWVVVSTFDRENAIYCGYFVHPDERIEENGSYILERL